MTQALFVLFIFIRKKVRQALIEKIKKWFKDHIDYHITGEYYEKVSDGHYQKKYLKKYYFKKSKQI